MNLEGIRKSYPMNNLYSNKKEDTKYFNMPKNSNITNFKRAFDKFSDKNVILNHYSQPTFILSNHITFKGLNKENSYKKLSYSEYYNILPNVEEKLKEFNIQTKVNINNILIADKILSNKDLAKSKNLISNLDWIMTSTYTSEQAQTKLDLLDKILSDEKLYNSKNLMNHLGTIVRKTSDKDQLKFNLDLIKKIQSDKKLHNNQNIIDNLGSILEDINNKEDTNIKLDIINACLNNKFCSNDKFMNKIGDILYSTKTPEEKNIRLFSMQYIASDNRLYNNKNFMDKSGDIILECDNLKKMDIKKNYINKIFSNEKLYNNQTIINNLGNIIASIDENNIKITDKIFTDILSKQPKNTDTENIELLTLSKNGNFNSISEIKEYKKLFDSAKDKKNQLKVSNIDLSDKNIEDFFNNTKPFISRTIQMFGNDVLEATFQHNLTGLRDFVYTSINMKNSLSPKQNEKLLLKFNPKSSAEYQSLQQEIKELKEQYSTINSNNDEKTLKELQNKINTKTKQARELIQNAPNIDPQIKIKKIKALSALTEDKDFDKFLDLIKTPTKENEQTWNLAINQKIFKNIGIDYNEKLSDRLNLTDNKYLSDILAADEDFNNNFKELLILIKNNPNKSYNEIFNELPQNIKTKEMFENIGIDYDKWVNADKNSFKTVEVKTKVEDVKNNAITALEKDFNDKAFTSLPEEYTKGIYEKLEDKGITLKDSTETIFDAYGYNIGTNTFKRLYYDEKPIEFNKLKDVMNILKEEMNKDIWTTTNSDNQIENNRLTMYTHLLKDRYNQIKQAQDIKQDKVTTLEIHKTDMNNIGHSLFLGNHASCCTSVGSGCNQSSAPTYIKNKMVSAIEIVDGDNFIGNTMCYIAKVDGKPSLILDNIELKGGYQFNDKIRDTLFDYSKQLREEIGKPDLDIYAGPNRHKLNMEHLPKAIHNLQLIGSTDNDKIYLDFISSERKVSGNDIDEVELYKIR